MTVLALRSLLFYVGYVCITVPWAVLSLAVAWALPLRHRFDLIIGRWTRMALWWLKVACDIRVHATGLERIPQQPCILLVKHQSAWETLWTQTLVAPQATLVKRELLYIPFWGWAFALTKPIAIDRASPHAALRRFVDEGRERLDQGMYVTLFPEGTRLPPGAHGKFQRGGAALAVASGRPVVVIAHNAGSHWPRGLLKRPGVISVEVSPPFATEGKKSSEINALCESWLRDAMRRLEGASGTRTHEPTAART